jgi:hypothetical protein
VKIASYQNTRHSTDYGFLKQARKQRSKVMRYVGAGILGVALVLGAGSTSVRAADVKFEASVHVGLDVSVFNDHLSPHGTWVEVPEYGRVWQPKQSASNRDWRPYLNDGRWVWTDGGWYWESTYEWGWAAFHYGRWTKHDKYNWVWSPDVTWAPAWVSWRHSDSVYGWAPLPHGSRFEHGTFVGVNVELNADFYSFVPSKNFLTVNLSSVAIPRERAIAVYKQTTIVNNSYVYNDNRVINNGIPVAQVAKATSQEIKPVVITEAKAPAEKGEAGKIAPYRPEIKEVPAKAETTEPAAATPKVADPKPAEPAVKPAEPAADTKTPAVAKPEEPNAKVAEPKTPPKLDEAKPKTAEPKVTPTADAKPAEAKPVEPKVKAVEPKPTPTPADAKPTETKPVEPKAKTVEPKTEPNATEVTPTKQEEPKAKPSEPKADATPAETKTKNSDAKPDAKPTEPKKTDGDTNTKREEVKAEAKPNSETPKATDKKTKADEPKTKAHEMKDEDPKAKKN